jgi:RNA recognition motif-containing protein
VVQSAIIITDKETGKSQGYGFVTMDDEAGAERAIAALDCATLDGRQISVRIAEDKKTIPQKGGPIAKEIAPIKLSYVKVEKPSDHTRKKRPRRQV